MTQTTDLTGSFNKASAMVSVGQVQLNTLSKYLADLPDNAKAELLVAPYDTARLFKRDLGTWNEDTASIRDINPSHGIHHDGQFLTGMPIFDRPDDAEDVTYEQAWATDVRRAWIQANASGKAVTTGLAIGTKKIVHGREIGADDLTVENNLYSRVGDINEALKAQGGQEIIIQCYDNSCVDYWQHTASEHPENRLLVHIVDFTYENDVVFENKDGGLASSRGIALQILPPTP